MPVVTLINGQSFPCEAGSTLLDAALASGLTLEHGCRTGRCGACKVRVLDGASVPLLDEPSLTGDEVDAGWILTCARQAAGDMSLDTEDLAALAGITPKLFPCRIDALRLVAPDVLEVRLRLPPNPGFAFLAGQYLDISGPGGMKRSYSVASSMRSPDRIELHVRRVAGGAMSRYWFEQAKVNDLLRFRGPLGTFFLRDVAGLDLVFLATGTGFAPVRSMLDQLAAFDAERRPASVSLYWGARLAQDLYADPSTALSNLRFTPVVSRPGLGWDGARGHVQQVCLRHRPAPTNAVVYACGSDAMIHSARTALIAAGLQPRRFYSDAFVSSD